MYEVWLASNRRAVLLGMAFPIAAEVIGILLGVSGWLLPNDILFWTGAGVFIIAQVLLVSIVIQLATPRIAFQNAHLLLYLRGAGPIRVPIDVVEGFLLGQGPAMLPGHGHDLETSTLVVKLADKAEAWQKVDVKPTIASWCNSYVTIRGTWCEPLNIDIVQRLNQKLADVQAQLKAGSEP